MRGHRRELSHFGGFIRGSLEEVFCILKIFEELYHILRLLINLINIGCYIQIIVLTMGENRKNKAKRVSGGVSSSNMPSLWRQS